MSTENQFAEIGLNRWLRDELAKMDTRGMKSPTLSIHSDSDVLFCSANCYDLENTFHCARGATVSEAFANLRAKVSADPAGQLRVKAAQLLAEADALEAKGGAL